MRRLLENQHESDEVIGSRHAANKNALESRAPYIVIAAVPLLLHPISILSTTQQDT